MQKVVDICKYVLINSHSQIKYFEKLLEKWNDPTDIASRTAQMLITDNQRYSHILLTILLEVQTNCKHPKKYHDICDGIKYCMNCNFDLENIK